MAADDSSAHLYTAWHPLFVWLIQRVLPTEWWDVLPEAQLTLEPQRADAIIVRRKDVAGVPEEPEYLRSVLSALRPHNVIHFKGATDELEVADVFQVIAYTVQWMNLRGITDPADMSIRVVASSISPRFLRQVQAMGGEVADTDMPGVREGHLGVFSLRVVDAVTAYQGAHEHLLYSVSSDALRNPTRLPPLDARETRMYHLLAQSVRQDRRDPTKKRRVMKDRELVDITMDEANRLFLESLTTEERMHGIATEERMRGIAPEERLRGIAPDELLRCIAPEERLRNLPPEYAFLAMSDTMLAQLPETLIGTLPEEIQAKIRARIRR